MQNMLVPTLTASLWILSGEAVALNPPANVDMGFTWTKYANEAAYVAELDRIATLSGGQFQYHTDRKCYGGSHDLYWVTVGDTEKPAIFMTSVLHAQNEWQGAHILLRFLEKTVTASDNQQAFNAALLDSHCIVAVPMANPWGYWESLDGKHYNNHPAPVPNIETYTVHDTELYDWYYGVNLNRNFDINWEQYGLLPWSVQSYWNGSDYGYANYFMMPYYLDENENLVYDPNNQHPNHVLGPYTDIYDYKGAAPFSEPETQLIRDLCCRFNLVGFSDWHLMNPWQSNNSSNISGLDPERGWIRTKIEEAVARVNLRHPGDMPMPAPKHIDSNTYDGGAPFATNWSAHKLGVRSFAWETGQNYTQQQISDVYLEMMYLSCYWMAK
jgi:hypothetical protein